MSWWMGPMRRASRLLWVEGLAEVLRWRCPPQTAVLPMGLCACLPDLQALDRWESRLDALFEGQPYDALDAALADTICRFPVHIQPFR